jgi:adenine deaminase
MSETTSVSGHIIDVINRNIFKGTIHISAGKIHSISEAEDVPDRFILPGFIDAHIHIESSMVTPYEFAKVALGHGTVATVSDPHEIANVCGLEGVNYMIENARNAGLKFFFGAPSCVPATNFENAGASLDSNAVKGLLASDDIWYLSEMMNYPGVLQNDPEVISKIKYAKEYHKPIDGHAPGLMGDEAKDYIQHGITTDHECFTLDEALNKLHLGMKIIIREGSAAKNFEALHSLIGTHPDMVMFCSDDKHPDDLITGHINILVKRALTLGYDLFDVLNIACVNPVHHYGIPVGLLRKGDNADFIVISDTKSMDVEQTWINGKPYYSDQKCLLPPFSPSIINTFNTSEITAGDLKVYGSDPKVPVIEAIDGSLITEKSWITLPIIEGVIQANPDQDILKICVINRYTKAPPAIGFIKNFGLKGCAIASTVAHDSHNIIAVGDDDVLISRAINLLMPSKGGLSASTTKENKHIALPIAGLMSDQSVDIIGRLYGEISAFAKTNGCTLNAPFMTLSFMALLVIPKIKISDKGMFDAEAFSFY